MIDLKFWFMFFGFLVLVAAFPAILAPISLKKIFKQIFKDVNHIRSIAIWYLSVGPLALYSGWMAPSYFASYIVALVGVAFAVQGILLFFNTKWYQKKILKPVVKLSETSFRISGFIGFFLGLGFAYYGLLFL